MNQGRILPLLVTIMLMSGVVGTALGQVCDTVTSRTSLGELSGQPIRSLRVVTLAPPPLPGVARVLSRLHVRTRESTVRRQLLFAAGDTVDTLSVAESLRQLRRLRYLSDVVAEGARCEGWQGVDLTIVTRDSWSTRATLRMQSNSKSLFALTERNVLGTGREVTLGARSDAGRIGLGVALRDPWLFGSNLAGEIGTNGFSDGREWYVSFGRREQSVFDRFGVTARAAHSVRQPADGTGDAFRRTTASLLLSRRVATSDVAVVSLLGGAEFERTALVAAFDAPLVGPDRVRREFSGLLVGLSRRSVRYDTLTWLLPRQALVDVPLAFEGEAVFSAGADLLTGAPAARIDLWAGQMWVPRRDLLATADVWGSGYRGTAGWEAATVRAALALYHPAPGGVWAARLAGERLVEPDPDVRALASHDQTLHALPDQARLAEAVLSTSLERSVHLLGLSRSWVLDGAAFGASSIRWDSAVRDPSVPASERTYVVVVGLGLRLAPAKLGRGTARLDIGYPIVRSNDVPGRVYVGISVVPWIDALRRRDGRQER